MESETPEIPAEFAQKFLTLRSVVWFIGFSLALGTFYLGIRDRLADSRKEDVQAITKSVDASIDAHTNAVRSEISVQVAQLQRGIDATNSRIDNIQVDRADKLQTFTDRDNKQDQRLDGLDQLTHQHETEFVRFGGKFELLTERFDQLQLRPRNN